MSIRLQLFAIALSVVTPFIFYHCATTGDSDGTGFDAQAREDAFDEPIDFNTAQSCKLLNLEQEEAN